MMNIWNYIVGILFVVPFVSGYKIELNNKIVSDAPRYIENLVPDIFSQNYYPIIELSPGYVRGNWLTSARGNRYAAYKGIPYAEPPLGDLRFEPPQEKKSWYGIRNAFNHGPQCPQRPFLINKYIGHEDCLYLNLYVPQRYGTDNRQSNANEELLPILFFIHGGAWTMGAGDMDNYLYGPDRFMDENVILVTLNYRLGALGFLYLENIINGNMGLKDQAMALKLINSNARSFGGDPDRITIMGESAGGASVEFHALNPETSKLISGVIAQSGSVMAPWAWTRPDVLDTRTRRLAKFLSCPDSAESYNVIDCIKKARPEDITKYQFATDWSPSQIPIGISFSPTSEPRDSSDPYITECPREILANLRNNPHGKPYLTGFNTLEGQLFTKIAVGLVDSVIQSGVKYPLNLPGEIRSVEYFRGKPYVSQPSPAIVDNIIGDYQFKSPAMKTLKYHSWAGTDVYFYHFSFSGRNNFARLFWQNQASTHMDELTYLFQGRGIFNGLPQLVDSSPEAVVSKRLIKMWTNFVKTGNPTPVNDTDVNISWPVGPSKMLLIGKELTIVNSPLETGWSGFLDKQCFR